MNIGTVRELWRFPVKSMGGERVDETSVGERGLLGDRLWAVRDDERNVLTNAKRIPTLLRCSARYLREPAADVAPGSIPDVVVTFPDGSTIGSDDPEVHARLSAFVGRRVTLCALRPAEELEHYRAAKATADEMRSEFAVDRDEPLPDFSMMPLGKLLQLGTYATPPGTYFDAMALHVITTSSLAAMRARSGADFDVRRFRANIVVDSPAQSGLIEAEWTGGTLTAGSCAAFVDCPTPRCSMPTRAQSGLGADPKVLKALVDVAQRCIGAYATVTRGGTIRLGDDVSFEPPNTTRLGDWARRRATGLKRVLLRAALPK